MIVKKIEKEKGKRCKLEITNKETIQLFFFIEQAHELKENEN